MKLYEFKVYPQGLGRSVYRVIRISGIETLDGLCAVILDAFDFSQDHLYEFCMDNKMYSGNSYQVDWDGTCEKNTTVSLDSLLLAEGQIFTFHYDFGDDWLFTIKVRKIEESDRPIQPAVTQRKGCVTQYQYSDCEE
ncbi:MAG: plasmid pRiA4b ORF-3 family protein [Oscillospiraceae bacterium]|nr:plasmid pRiA4b ORF-3 family protein [Oscillospiraceae bacterium]